MTAAVPNVASDNNEYVTIALLSASVATNDRLLSVAPVLLTAVLPTTSSSVVSVISSAVGSLSLISVITTVTRPITVLPSSSTT